MGKEHNEDVVETLETMLGLNEDTAAVVPVVAEGEPQKKEETTVAAPATAALVSDQHEILKDIARVDIQIEALTSATVDMGAFYDGIENHLSEEEQALEFEDKSAYMKLVAAKAKEYEANNSTTAELEKLQEQKSEMENTLARSAAVVSISTKYPDFDYEKVHAFFQNKLTKEQQDAVYEKSTSYEEVYENSYKLFIESNPSNIHTQTTPNIPNVNTVRKQNVTDKVIDNGLTSDDEKLRAALGL